MEQLVIFGSGNVAKLAYFVFTHDSDYNVVAFTVEKKFIKAKSLFDRPIIPYEKITEKFSPEKNMIFIALGAQDRNEQRERIFFDAKSKGYQLVSYISSKSEYWHNIDHGENVFIVQDTSIEPWVKLGNNVFLIGTKIGQGVIIGDNCFLSTATIGSYVNVGKNTFIGINATINPEIKIGQKSIIGPAALITRDVEEYSIYTAPAAQKRSVDSRALKLW